MKLPRFTLKLKLLVFFIIISTFPLIMINLLWFNSSQNQALKTTETGINTAATDMGHQIESFFETKRIGLILHSQTQSILELDTAKAIFEMQTFMLQDQDILELSLINPSGKEILHLNRNRIFTDEELTDQSSSLAFKVPTYTGGEQYISSLSTDQNNIPVIYIAVPVVKPVIQQELAKITTSSSGRSRKNGEILGVLKVSYNLNSLWQRIQTFKIGKDGYVFLVDNHGNILIHPKKEFNKGQVNVKNIYEVAKFLSELNLTQVATSSATTTANKYQVNELGVPSLTSHAIIPITNWAVIAQIPISDTLFETNQIASFAIILFLVILSFVVLTSFWVSRQIVEPIEELQKGSRYIGEGNLHYRLSIESGDEIEELGSSFNNMAISLQTAFQKLAQDTSIISGERNKLEVTVSNIADGVIAVNLQREIVIFNKAAQKLTGFTEEQALGRPIQHLVNFYDKNFIIPPDVYCPIKNDDFEGLIYSHQGVRLQSVDYTSSNGEIYVNIASGKIKESNQINLGCILTLHDVTEEKRLEEMKLDFVSMAAHELRTPLTSIRGYLSVFIKENSANFNAEQNKFLERISFSTQQLMSLVENLLNVSRIEKGVFTLNLEPVEWLSVVKQIIEDLKNKAQEKNINLVYTKPTTEIPKIMADKLRINEVLINLISNAIAYTPSGGTIEVFVEKINNEVVTHVKDNGEGIAKEALSHLFTKFFRAWGKLEMASKGTGLGLYISKTIIDMHHGKIWVQSEIGKGSVFSFSLQVAQTKSS